MINYASSAAHVKCTANENIQGRACKVITTCFFASTADLDDCDAITKANNSRVNKSRGPCVTSKSIDVEFIKMPISVFSLVI